MCIYLNAYIIAYIYTCIYVCIHWRVRVSTCVYVDSGDAVSSPSMFMYIYAHMYMYVCIYVCVWVYTCLWVGVHICVCGS